MRLLEAHEPGRLAALARIDAASGPRQPHLDALVTLARRCLHAPMAALNLVDEQRCRPLASDGWPRRSLPRAITFCREVVAREQLVHVADALGDTRFADSPLVTSGPRVRSYAGAPIADGRGYVVGSFCVFDTRPRRLDARAAACLLGFARLAGAMLDLHDAERVRPRADARDHDHREELLAIVSHDLRNPLSTILTSTDQLLDRHQPLADGQRAALERCRRAARRMTRMIGDLLDAASVASGTLSLECREQDLGRIVLEAIDLLQPLAEARGLTFAVELGPGELRVRCDRERVVQVLSNLVGNAIKFSPRGSVIRIAAAPWEGRARLQVSDEGPGIAPEIMPRIFERYVHAGDNGHGAGLGLYIAKGIVEGHGGEIWVDSRPGRTTFYFTLPGVAPSPSQPQEETRKVGVG
jgi:signal transduction histidine kinase